MKTLILNGDHKVVTGELQRHGAELKPDSLPQETIDQWLDQRWLVEVPQRRSLYRMFWLFSGAKEKEPLDEAEVNELCLPV